MPASGTITNRKNGIERNWPKTQANQFVPTARPPRPRLVSAYPSMAVSTPDARPGMPSTAAGSPLPKEFETLIETRKATAVTGSMVKVSGTMTPIPTPEPTPGSAPQIEPQTTPIARKNSTSGLVKMMTPWVSEVTNISMADPGPVSWRPRSVEPRNKFLQCFFDRPGGEVNPEHLSEEQPRDQGEEERDEDQLLETTDVHCGDCRGRKHEGRDQEADSRQKQNPDNPHGDEEERPHIRAWIAGLAVLAAIGLNEVACCPSPGDNPPEDERPGNGDQS